MLWGASHVALVVKNSPANAGDVSDVGSILGSRRSLGVANRNPLQYSCLGNPMNRGAWQATVHGVATSQTWLSNWTHTHTHTRYELKVRTLTKFMLQSWPQWDHVRREVFGRRLGHLGGILISRISTLIKETPETSLALFTMWGHSKKWALPRTWVSWHLDIGLPSLQTCEKYIPAASKPSVYGTLLQQSEWTKNSSWHLVSAY